VSPDWRDGAQSGGVQFLRLPALVGPRDCSRRALSPHTVAKSSMQAGAALATPGRILEEAK
jgi:hypothetical protein